MRKKLHRWCCWLTGLLHSTRTGLDFPESVVAQVPQDSGILSPQLLCCLNIHCHHVRKVLLDLRSLELTEFQELISYKDLGVHILMVFRLNRNQRARPGTRLGNCSPTLCSPGVGELAETRSFLLVRLDGGGSQCTHLLLENISLSKQ